MRFETFVALRYLRGKRRSRFVNVITLISIGGVSVGVIALIVVMSVMTGFDNELRKTIIGNRSHLTVELPGGAPIGDPDLVIGEIERLCPEIVASSPFTQVLALITHGKSIEPAYILGVDPERETEVTNLAENLSDLNGRTAAFGDLPGEDEIVLGYALAGKLGASVGSEVTAYTPRGRATPFGWRPGQKKLLEISGISQAQMSDFDAFYGWVTLPTAKVLKGQEGVDAIHVRLTNPDLAAVVADRIEENLGYRTMTWYESQRDFFMALQQEKVVMFIILVFIVLVAAFNITSTLIMLVMEKKRDIGILRTIGTSSRSILSIFVFEGLYIGLSGTLLGVILGNVLAWQLNRIAEVVGWILGVDLYNTQIYYFDRIPVDVVPMDVVIIAVSAVALTFLSTVYPAWNATRIDPVDALRNE